MTLRGVYRVCFTMDSATLQKNLRTSRLEWPFTSRPVLFASKSYVPLVPNACAQKACIPSALELRFSLRLGQKSFIRVRAVKSKFVSRCKTRWFGHVCDPK